MDATLPLVSINITTYNRAHLLPRCLDSILSQTYKNIEIIIVDDHSNDNTKQVIHCYKINHRFIKSISHNNNLGNATARNTALKNSNGKYIAFMDDDDEWTDKNKLQKQVDIFEDPNNAHIGIICSGVNLIHSDETVPKIIAAPKHIKKMILKGNGYIYSPTVMTKRQIMLIVDGFDTTLRRGIDSDFYRKCILKYRYQVYFMSEITTNIYEIGTDRITMLTSKESLLKHIASNIICIKNYFSFFLRYPDTLLYRLARITKAAYKLFLISFC